MAGLKAIEEAALAHQKQKMYFVANEILPVFPTNAKECEFAKTFPADSQLKFNDA